MKKGHIPWMAAILLLCLTGVAHALESFEGGTGLWTANFIAGGPGQKVLYWSEPPLYHSEGGNPGGYMAGQIQGSGDRRFYAFDSSASPFGDLTGATLTVDYRMTGSATGPAPATVRFYVGTEGADYFVSVDAYSWDGNLGNGAWATRTIPVVPSAFMAWPGQSGGLKSFEEVVRDPLWVGLVFGGDLVDPGSLGITSTAGALVGIDNFGTVVPIPGTWWLFVPGLAGLAFLRRKL